MLVVQFFLKKTNQPHGFEMPLTSSVLREIARISTYDHTPNKVLSELRDGFAVETLSGFYMARDDGR